MNQLSDLKAGLDTADSATKLLEPFLKRAEAWRFGQRVVVGVALVTLAVSLLTGVSKPQYTVAAVFLVTGISFLTRERTWIAARHIGIKDDAGNYRVLLTTEGNAPTLAFMDETGEVRLRCGLNISGTPSLSLHDHSMVIPRAMLCADPTSTPSLVLTDGKGHLRLQLSLSPSTGEGLIGVIGECGQPVVIASEFKGQGHLKFQDGTGKPVLVIPEKRAA